MTHWDGLASSNSQGMPQRICILGATNRIQDIDEAILRRMSKKFPVSLPSAHQRRRIFKLILKDTKLDTSHFDLDYLVRLTAGMSGSDIKEACRDAAMGPVREYIKEKKRQGTLGRGSVNPDEVRGVRTSDFFVRTGAGSKRGSNGLLTPAASTPREVVDISEEEVDGEEFEDADRND